MSRASRRLYALLGGLLSLLTIVIFLGNYNKL